MFFSLFKWSCILFCYTTVDSHDIPWLLVKNSFPCGANVHMQTSMYACMYVCMYVYMYVCMYVCTYVRMYVCTYVRMYVCTYVRMYVCTYVRMYVCMLCYVMLCYVMLCYVMLCYVMLCYVCMYVYLHVTYMCITRFHHVFKTISNQDCPTNQTTWWTTSPLFHDTIMIVGSPLPSSVRKHGWLGNPATECWLPQGKTYWIAGSIPWKIQENIPISW